MTRDEHHDAHLLAAKSGADIRTVRKWLSGGSVSNVSRVSLERWAKELGIQPPGSRGCICHETVVGKNACPVHGPHPSTAESREPCHFVPFSDEAAAAHGEEGPRVLVRSGPEPAKGGGS
jgi:hypothetical protein